MGDTGLRLKPSNLGLGKLGSDNSPEGPDCTAPPIYGINQCYTNFTQEDLTQNQTGSFQGIDEWYFKEMADSAAEEDIDLIVYVGDYLCKLRLMSFSYSVRLCSHSSLLNLADQQGPCPLNNTAGADCSAVNLPSFINEPITEGTVMNFIPGTYGDNWWG